VVCFIPWNNFSIGLLKLKYSQDFALEDHLNVRFSCNDQTFFEILKMKIRSISITYSIKKSREEKSLYRTLENDIQNLENIMNSSPDVYKIFLF
jgi:hypothetical protein